MSNRKSHNNATMTLRLPDAILTQYTQLCDNAFKTPSEMTRQLIIDFVRNNQAFVLAKEHAKHTPNAKPFVTLPRMDQAIENDWDY
jgi:predicted transcriptional regulator